MVVSLMEAFLFFLFIAAFFFVPLFKGPEKKKAKPFQNQSSRRPKTVQSGRTDMHKFSKIQSPWKERGGEREGERVEWEAINVAKARVQHQEQAQERTQERTDKIDNHALIQEIMRHVKAQILQKGHASPWLKTISKSASGKITRLNTGGLKKDGMKKNSYADRKDLNSTRRYDWGERSATEILTGKSVLIISGFAFILFYIASQLS